MRRRTRRGTSPWLAAVILTVALVVGAAAAVGVRWLQYSDHVLPGVEAAGVDLGGMDEASAAAALREGLQPRLDRRVGVSVDGKLVAVRPGTALRLDADATAEHARDAGRGSWWSQVTALALPWPPKHSVEPVLRIDGYGAAGIAKKLSRQLPTPRAARVRMEGTEPVVVASKPGVRVVRKQVLERLRVAALDGGRAVVAPLQNYEPPVRTAAAEDAAAAAARLVSADVRLTHEGRSIGAVSPVALARLLRFRERGTQLAVGFDRQRLTRVVRPALDPWRRRATNAQFVVNGTSVAVQPARDGLDVDPGRALDAVTAAASGGGGRVAELALRSVPADLTTDEARALGIRQRVSTFTTDMGTSSSNRIHNVHLMADYIDGTIVKPGQTFSFNKTVGPRTTGRGFLEGQMIVGSLLVPSIGGGVCQTATTLFNNAFELGLPILERHNHSFYISHYPLGRDATVSWDGPDFAFRNDLKHALLIKTSYTSSTLTFSFYGTDAQRRVVALTGPKVNWRSPKTSYALDPYAPRGSVRSVAGSNQPGFEVTVERKVYERGKLKRDDRFTSTYVAVGPTTIYGPGRTIPGSYFVLPRV